MSFYKKWHFWVFLIISLCCIGVIIYGIYTHKEPGFMEVCWSDGVGICSDCEPREKFQCKDPSTLKWKRTALPLRVDWNFDSDHQEYSKLVARAIDWWNADVAIPLFVRAVATSHSQVYVRWGSVKGKAAASTKFYGSPETGITRAVVTLREAAGVVEVFGHLRHELGHTLGLAHDSFARSIMAPGISDDEVKIRVVTDHDRALLREEYGK